LIAKKIEESKAADRERKRLSETLAAYEAKELYDAATTDARCRVVTKVFDASTDAAYVRS